MYKQKGLAPLVIIILIAFAVGGYLIYQKPKPILKPQQISQPTAAPIPYTDKGHEIILQHPKELEVIKRNISKVKNLGELGDPDILDFNLKYEKRQLPIMTLLIYDNSKGLSLKDFQEELRVELMGDSIPLWTEADTKIVTPRGITVYYGDEKLCGSYECRRYSWQGGDKIFEFVLYRDYLSTYGQTFDQILSKLEFLPSSSIPVGRDDKTDNWKTYINTKFGYSIEYPGSWRLFKESMMGNISVVALNDTNSEGGPTIILEVDEEGSRDSRKYILENISPRGKPQKVRNVNVDGIVGEKWDFNSDTTEDYYAIFLNKNNKKYILIKELSNVDMFKDLSLKIDQILSTFKFTQ